MKMLNIINFVKEVKQEGKKIVWPTRKETLITTAMVLLMVVIFSIFFLLVDNIIAWFIKLRFTWFSIPWACKALFKHLHAYFGINIHNDKN